MFAMTKKQLSICVGLLGMVLLAGRMLAVFPPPPVDPAPGSTNSPTTTTNLTFNLN